MKSRHTLPPFLFSVLFSLFFFPCVPWFQLSAAEPWADPRLKVRDGLELWLDATRVGPEPKAGPIDVWNDASGHDRHVRQPAKDARPTLIPHAGVAVVQFDGVDDHFRGIKPSAELKAFTVFVVAAPKTSPGGFPGLLAFNAADRRDYESGITIDLGPYGTPRFGVLNVEGRGFGGFRSLMTGDGPFGKLHALEVRGTPDAVRLVVDGKAHGSRPRDGSPLSLDEVTVGARYYTNGPGPQQVRGPVRADVAEVLVYSRVLTIDETQAVRGYLDAKYAELRKSLPPDGDGRSEPLVPVENPPPVQVFLPGFTVRELPLALTNINNVKYRPDGTLVALGYNGNVWLLRDTDGDGLEDKAELFWENKAGALRGPIGMELTPPNYPAGEGVFVPSKGRLTLLLDTDRDGKADKEVIVAGPYPEIVQSVDTLGVAIDKDGSVYYGRGCFDYTNGYRVGKDGKAAYSLTEEYGTIIRVAPDFKSREIVATGIRFPVAMRFNRHGDLFCTDQEGATWLPNGNPLDELLHVQKGRHYGFPPRHPKHLPNVIDEPSTFDYGPQHQSTCGLSFNEPVKPGGPTFGPKDWAGDALVAGYSRGKLYRTKLVKTPAGYVAKTYLLACANMLTADCCITPDGGLVVAAHSGGPDWGTGPTGKGKLYKIVYSDKEHPQPVLAWPAGPREVRVEFDRPVNPELLRDVVRQTKVTAGAFVRAGDRFESLWPGYAVVQAEKVAPRYDVPVRSAQLTPDRRTLVLAVDPFKAAVHYAITLPGMRRPAKPGKGELPQHSQIDLDFDLSGVETTWTPKDGGPEWSGWLPHADLQVARALTAGSAPHDALWAATAKPGDLTLKTQLNLTDMLRPAVQPGSRIDHAWPNEVVSLAYPPLASLVSTTPTAPVVYNSRTPDRVAVVMRLQPERGVAVQLTARQTKTPEPTFWLYYSTNYDTRFRALPLHRSLVPWADSSPKAFEQAIESVKVPELEGGSWARGRAVYFDAQHGCAKCHSVHGQGAAIGPDLTNLVHRDYASVMRDVTKPSFAINPDYLTHAVSLTDGRTLTGVLRTVGDKLHVGDKDGKVTIVDRSDVESMKPAPVSTMPEDLLKPLGSDRTRDLMTFLLTAPPRMPRDHPGPRPKPRTKAEVEQVLAGAPNPPAKTRPIRVVLVAGAKDHGPGEHDYPAWQKVWQELLSAAANVEVATAMDWPAKEEFQKADVMVFYQYGNWDAKRAADIDAYLDRGGGLVYVHWAVAGRANAAEFARRIGLASGTIKFRHGPLDLAFNKELKHPIARNFGTLKLVDESYWQLTGDLPADRVIASGIEEKAPRPLFWSLERGKGRVFVSIPGHFSWTFDDPLFRVLLFRGTAWAAKEPVDRFNDLVWPGADVTD